MKSNKVTVGDKVLKCMFCGHDDFVEKDVALGERWSSWLDMEVFSKTGKAYICTNCGFNHEFFGKNTK